MMTLIQIITFYLETIIMRRDDLTQLRLYSPHLNTMGARRQNFTLTFEL